MLLICSVSLTLFEVDDKIYISIYLTSELLIPDIKVYFYTSSTNFHYVVFGPVHSNWVGEHLEKRKSLEIIILNFGGIETIVSLNLYSKRKEWQF